MKTPINPWSVVVYILAPAIVLGFVLSAVPALLDNAPLAKILGLIGLGVGAVLGLVRGIAVRFR